ncbi:MAG: LuxR C-terminal-related transcriptional regulator [Nocardioides sp.]|uniref:response regulator transcription factor n=1 Tax=Nocardioides sp. TaxID=35761 RepID=UPI0023A134A7|nr:LuxR C-terminal-related transcriptional regulator [Nocardioides sp.]MDE0778884.1 LuxR C-terminal-related transcriptional regulator [Nocardioides sp.]
MRETSHRDRDWGLSPRELEVLQMIGHGLSNVEICLRLHLSMNTIKTHIRTAYRRIGVNTRAKAVIWAYRNGLVEENAEWVEEASPDVGDTPTRNEA